MEALAATSMAKALMDIARTKQYIVKALPWYWQAAGTMRHIGKCNNHEMNRGPPANHTRIHLAQIPGMVCA